MHRRALLGVVPPPLVGRSMTIFAPILRVSRGFCKMTQKTQFKRIVTSRYKPDGLDDQASFVTIRYKSADCYDSLQKWALESNESLQSAALFEIARVRARNTGSRRFLWGRAHAIPDPAGYTFGV